MRCVLFRNVGIVVDNGGIGPCLSVEHCAKRSIQIINDITLDSQHGNVFACDLREC